MGMEALVTLYLSKCGIRCFSSSSTSVEHSYDCQPLRFLVYLSSACVNECGMNKNEDLLAWT